VDFVKTKSDHEPTLVSSQKEFAKLINSYEKHLVENSENWLPITTAGWIRKIIQEICDIDCSVMEAIYKANRKQCEDWRKCEPEEYLTVWKIETDLVEQIVFAWFNLVEFETIVERTKAFDHVELLKRVPSVVKLHGEYIESLSLKIPKISKSEAKEELEKYSHFLEDPGFVEMFKPYDGEQNLFNTRKEVEEIGTVQFIEGNGTLGVNVNAKDPKAADIGDKLDIVNFHEMFGSGFQLYEFVFCILKTENYATVYHQDVATIGPITIYNQVSKLSLFHGVPLLIAYYYRWLIKKQDYVQYKEAVTKIENLGWGRIVAAGPGDVLLVSPGAGHMVAVPSTKDAVTGVRINASLKNQEGMDSPISAIRAVEMFIGHQNFWSNWSMKLSKGCSIKKKDLVKKPSQSDRGKKRKRES